MRLTYRDYEGSDSKPENDSEQYSLTTQQSLWLVSVCFDGQSESSENPTGECFGRGSGFADRSAACGARRDRAVKGLLRAQTGTRL